MSYIPSLLSWQCKTIPKSLCLLANDMQLCLFWFHGNIGWLGSTQHSSHHCNHQKSQRFQRMDGSELTPRQAAACWQHGLDTFSTQGQHNFQRIKSSNCKLWSRLRQMVSVKGDYEHNSRHYWHNSTYSERGRENMPVFRAGQVCCMFCVGCSGHSSGPYINFPFFVSPPGARWWRWWPSRHVGDVWPCLDLRLQYAE